jgi:hypothetical protein
MRCAIFLASLLLTACGTLKPPKNVDQCAINTFANPPKMICYNSAKDFIYDAQGIRLKPGAKGRTVEHLTLRDLNGGVWLSARSYAEFRAWRDNLWRRYNEGEFSCKKK